MRLQFADIEEFEENYNDPNVVMALNETKCRCGSAYEMELKPVEINVAGRIIKISECPVMVCGQCRNEHICSSILQPVYVSYHNLVRDGYDICKLTVKADQRFDYAVKANYKYDPRDMSIPGIGTDLDPFRAEGFSCPVFFDRKVLNNFFTDGDYELDFFSESYGTIAKRGTGGWKYEWQIVFGVNRNNRVIMFLGDLDQIDEDDRAVLWLKSYNIESDHCIIDTELYKGQFQCEFSEPIIERRIISLRNAFFAKIQRKYGIELYHLEQEIEKKGAEIRKPINYSPNEVKENIVILDSVLNEGIDCKKLRELCATVIDPVPTDINDLKTRKLLQRIIALEAGEVKAREIISPLFYLNDLRVCFAHLISQNEIEKYQQNIVDAFGLSRFDEYQKLYDTLLDKLYNLYKYLYMTEI